MEPAIEPSEKTDEHDVKEELAEEENITDHLRHQPMQVNEMTQSTAGGAKKKDVMSKKFGWKIVYLGGSRVYYIYLGCFGT